MKMQHHGRHRFYGKNDLCTMKSYTEERIGRFGRIFRTLQPHYVDPLVLAQIANSGGPMDSGNTAQFTQNVPLGMIFFGQFIDHDITFDTQSNFTRINNPASIENVRTANLDLDCIFGGGPEDEPFLYDRSGGEMYLLTGETNNNIGQGPALERHDLARTGTGTAIIGDPRNDENRVISQLQLAMIQFYNKVYDHVKAANPSYDASEIYEEARELTTWHYQWVVVNEFLPILCGKPVVDRILSTGRKFYCPINEAFIPVEFSVAAYRFGHSMIAQEMKLQPGGQVHPIFSPQIGVGFTPIKNQNQVVDWECFFDLNGNFQLAEKLDTKMASFLLNLPFVDSTNPADKSLATRNLRRGQSFLLPSGESVAALMGRPQSEIDDVKNRINNIVSGVGVNFDAGTPLWFYILAEAEEIGREEPGGGTIPGEGMGPVAANIVAETIIGLLELDDTSYLGSNRDWQPSLGPTAGQFTMADLLGF